MLLLLLLLFFLSPLRPDTLAKVAVGIQLLGERREWPCCFVSLAVTTTKHVFVYLENVFVVACKL